MFDVIGDVSDDGDAHDEDLEFDVLDLVAQLFLRCALQDLVDCDFPLLLLSYLASLALQLTLYLPPSHAIGYLLRNLLVAVVDNLNQEISALVNGSPIEHERFKYVADN